MTYSQELSQPSKSAWIGPELQYNNPGNLFVCDANSTWVLYSGFALVSNFLFPSGFRWSIYHASLCLAPLSSLVAQLKVPLLILMPTIGLVTYHLASWRYVHQSAHKLFWRLFSTGSHMTLLTMAVPLNLLSHILHGTSLMLQAFLFQRGKMRILWYLTLLPSCRDIFPLQRLRARSIQQRVRARRRKARKRRM